MNTFQKLWEIPLQFNVTFRKHFFSTLFFLYLPLLRANLCQSQPPGKAFANCFLLGKRVRLIKPTYIYTKTNFIDIFSQCFLDTGKCSNLFSWMLL